MSNVCQQQRQQQQHQEFNEVYADILKACQSFYELPRSPYASALQLSPRLEDGLLEMSDSNNSANPQDPDMDAIQYDGCCTVHHHTPRAMSDYEQRTEAQIIQSSCRQR
ncbi:unnamed protein product [Cylindrotheca closterium]|uniref:Uncharacterized protein n=1 Tax=Cylindrotheca closterium TaxID=2856 RepID=A0AAD2CVJ9_9STRA|nr:unnamed protein product [Cylindrotheca closterium]